jgi:hypothetical protein
MFTEFQVNHAYFKAFQERISLHTVGISMHARRGIGTGVLVSFGSQNLILTAGHNLGGTSVEDLLFHFRPEGSLQETTMSEFEAKARTLRPDASYQLKFSTVVRDEVNDIAALVLSAEEKPRGLATHCDLTACHPLKIPDQTSVLLLGFPVAYSAPIGPRQKMLGVSSDHLLYDSTLNDLGYLPSSYDPEHQFLLKYKLAEEGLLPHGFSGSGTWCGRDVVGRIWRPEPLLIGIVTGYLRESQLLVVAGLPAICALLSRV